MGTVRRFVLVLLFAGAAAVTAAKGPYSIADHTRLGYYANAHAFDAASNRIYSSSRDGVYAVDSARHKVLGLIARVPSGSVSLDAAAGELYVLARNEDQLRVVDVNARKIVRSFAAPALFNVIFEPTRKELYYVRGNATDVRVAERTHGETVATIPLDGYPSYVVADPPRNRVLVRLYNRDLIQVIDTNEHRVTVSWPMRADGASSMTVDAASGRVFVSSGKDVKMLDGLSGKELGHFPAGDQVASIAFDPETKLVSALWGGRYINVARVDLMALTPVQSIDLMTPTRQIFLDAGTHTVFALCAITDTQGFARAGSPDPATAPRISSLLTLRYKEPSVLRPLQHVHPSANRPSIRRRR
jgi:DNA-binding beta-propeller fold protein YncE